MRRADVQFPVGTVYLSSFEQGTVNGLPSLNDLAVDGALNTTNQPNL